MSAGTYDVAVIGAGPVGAATALACAQRGSRVLLIEQDPWPSAERMVGEWLHPPAVDVLEGLGVELTPPLGYATGRGFVVFPDDSSEPIVLPYRAPRSGFAMEHDLLLETLRAHAQRHEGIDYVPFARALRLEGDALTIGCVAHDDGSTAAFFERSSAAKNSAMKTVRASRVVGATGSGPRPIARGDVLSFGGVRRGAPTHRIAGLTLGAAELPFEGYSHLCAGGPGPAIAYRIGPSRVRLLLDVPLSFRVPRDGGIELFEAYAPAIPKCLHEPLREALAHGGPTWTHGQLRPRTDLVGGGIFWAGDAAGSLHPLTGAGLTLGLGDAAAVARASNAQDYRRDRWRKTRVPETVSIGLTELFTDTSPETDALRRASFHVWREHSSERLRTMSFVAGEGASLRFGRSCVRVMARAAGDVWTNGIASGQIAHAGDVSTDLLRRIGWMLGGSLGWTERLPDSFLERIAARGDAAARFGPALHSTASPRGEVVGLTPTARRDSGERIEQSLARAVDALVAEQDDDGSFEGEVVWCPMLAAQYVLACHVMQRPIDEVRKRRILLHFQETRLPGGAWGLHEKSDPYLFVTTLVYVAARILGLAKDDALLSAARTFIRDEGGALGIPSWGKLWLALVGLYEWRGVTPMVPELWGSPRWLPMHPSRYYCHTRLIYMGMATLYGARVQAELTPTVRALRDEIFLAPYHEIDFAAARETLRDEEIHAPPSTALKLAYRGLALLDRTRSASDRKPLLTELRERIRYELRSTSHTCISPVSGLLDILALWSADPNDEDVAIALERFDGWIWEDDVEGARVCGARSATWDTSFAVQALSVAAPFVDVKLPLLAADEFLRTQQIAVGTGREADNDRLDPSGGYCFAGVWHGWPVSDCTAEAMLARLESPYARPSVESMRAAVQFVLRTQNSDGGFGSYEARRVDLPIEWLNPSEMFGACMTEKSYVECTASCVAALGAFRHRHPDILRSEVEASIERGVRCLRQQQRPDGSWTGTWGVHFIYGTMFGVRGLLAAGVPSIDPQIRRACAWLKERQRHDGGWGEHFTSVFSGHYVEHAEGQTVQTAWALSTLLEANDPDFAALERAADFLARAQNSDGTWAKQDPEGIFFHTALLEYRLYRSYFPLWALASFRRRATARAFSQGRVFNLSHQPDPSFHA